MIFRFMPCALLLVLLCVSAAPAKGKAPAWNEASVLATTTAWADMMGKADVAALQKL